MSLLSKLSNKIQLVASKQLDDPEAQEFARQKDIQERQDAEVRQREQAQKEQEDEEAAQSEEDKAAADELLRRSEFKPYRAVGNAASEIIKILLSMALFIIILYGGHLAVNQAIGYRNPFRILSFIYGMVFFFLVIPKVIYETNVLNKPFKTYTFLPLSTYTPTGNFETFFLTPFCYVEDQFAIDARKAVESLYAAGLTASNSVKAAVAVTALAGATLKGINSSKSGSNNDPKKPNINSKVETNEPSKPESPKEAPKENPKPVTPEPPKEAPKPVTPEPPKETPKETPKEAPKPVTPEPPKEAPKPEAPKPVTPEPPKPEAPKPEAPKPEAPKPEAPKETPKEAPKPPTPQAPTPQASKPQAPKPPTPQAKPPKA
jgi:hypothetical protein